MSPVGCHFVTALGASHRAGAGSLRPRRDRAEAHLARMAVERGLGDLGQDARAQDGHAEQQPVGQAQPAERGISLSRGNRSPCADHVANSVGFR
jgi:hypothetical protein